MRGRVSRSNPRMGNELNCGNPFGDYEEEEDEARDNQELEHKEGVPDNPKTAKIYRVNMAQYNQMKAKEAAIGKGGAGDLATLSSEGNRFITDGHL